MGASTHAYRYSNVAIQKLVAAGIEVVALGASPGKVGIVNIHTEPEDWSLIDTVTIYLNPYHQQGYYQYLLDLSPRRVIFNPGAENDELRNLLDKNGVQTQYACTLVLISTGQY